MVLSWLLNFTRGRYRNASGFLKKKSGFYKRAEAGAAKSLQSLGFSRQEHWSGLPFPSPMNESESEVAQPCLTPSDPMDCSPPGSSVHGVFQARVLECGAIAFSAIKEQVGSFQGNTIFRDGSGCFVLE